MAKTTKAEQEVRRSYVLKTKTRVVTGTWKGTPTLSIHDEEKLEANEQMGANEQSWLISYGPVKWAMVCRHIDQIRAFVKQHVTAG